MHRKYIIRISLLDTVPDNHNKTPCEGYDSLAKRANTDLEGFESPWGDCPFQTYYSWPITRSLIPDCTDKRVLDAGCGIGDHVEWFLDDGAAIVGVDASEQTIEIARERFGDQATFHQANLAEPLDFVENDTFDLVLSHLVLGHIERWKPVFEEFHRILSARGLLIFATVHPLYHLEHQGATDYYTVEPVEIAWPDAPVTAYRRPFSEMINPLTAAGFRIEVLEEPKPQEEYEVHSPERYRKAMKRPEILCIRARVVNR
jgi:SAM-dependent methyltransferase